MPLFDVTFEITNTDGDNVYALSESQSIKATVSVEANNENQAEAFGLIQLKRALEEGFKVRRLKIKDRERPMPGNRNTKLENKKKKGPDQTRRPPRGSPDNIPGKGKPND